MSSQAAAELALSAEPAESQLQNLLPNDVTIPVCADEQVHPVTSLNSYNAVEDSIDNMFKAHSKEPTLQRLPVAVADEWTADSGGKQCIISLGSEESALFADPNRLQYYTVAEDVVVETVELADFSCQPWPDNEKVRLLRALKKHGSGNLDKLALALPEKTIQQIQDAIEHYRRLAAERMTLTAREVASRRLRARTHRRRTRDVSVPLAAWRTALAEQHSAEELRTLTGDALRLIARCEYFPSPELTSNVEFRQLYELLADAMSGRPPVQVSAESAALLRRALTEVSFGCKHLQTHGFAHHLERLSHADSGAAPASSSASSPAAAARCDSHRRLVRLLNQKSYNPLRVPEDLLRFLPHGPRKPTGTHSTCS